MQVLALNEGKGMDTIVQLLGLVVALLTAIQATPNLPPEVRAQALAISRQALIMAAPVEPAAAAPQTPAQPAQGASTSVSLTTTQAMPQEETRQESVAFSRTGLASAALAGSTLEIRSEHVAFAVVSFKNDTNETLRFPSNPVENTRFSITSSLEGYAPHVTGYFRGVALANDTRGIKPGEVADVQFYFDTLSSSPASIDARIDAFSLIGAESGEIVEVGGFPIVIPRVEIR